MATTGTRELNILVLGITGMLGHAVARVLRERTEWKVNGTQKSDRNAPGYLDLLEMPEHQWKTVLQQQTYHYVVNCIGILKPAVHETDSRSLRRAIQVNALFPHQLAEILPNASIVHVSTDGVFSGDAARPYFENDATDCKDAYGKTKALGECPADNVVTLRCSLIGQDPIGSKGLIEWILQTPEGSELPGFENQLWNGVTTTQFARLCRGIFESDSFSRIRAVSSVYHFCPNPPTTKYALLKMICEAAGKNVHIRKASASDGGRLLGTLFNQLREVYPDSTDWLPVLKEALTDSRVRT